MKDNSFSRFENSVEKSLSIKKVVIKEDPSVLTTKLGLNNTAQVRFHENMSLKIIKFLNMITMVGTLSVVGLRLV